MKTVKSSLPVIKRLSLKLASELPLPILIKLADGKITPDEVKDLSGLAASVVSQELIKMAEEKRHEQKH